MPCVISKVRIMDVIKPLDSFIQQDGMPVFGHLSAIP
ncbi:hypothetical protein D046_3335A, partial [Vibrio parahaemolyticus V-223/04]